MPKVTEILVRKEHNGQVWWEPKPVEEKKNEAFEPKVSLPYVPRCPTPPDIE